MRKPKQRPRPEPLIIPTKAGTFIAPPVYSNITPYQSHLRSPVRLADHPVAELPQRLPLLTTPIPSAPCGKALDSISMPSCRPAASQPLLPSRQECLAPCSGLVSDTPPTHPGSCRGDGVEGRRAVDRKTQAPGAAGD